MFELLSDIRDPIEEHETEDGDHAQLRQELGQIHQQIEQPQEKKNAQDQVAGCWAEVVVLIIMVTTLSSNFCSIEKSFVRCVGLFGGGGGGWFDISKCDSADDLADKASRGNRATTLG